MPVYLNVSAWLQKLIHVQQCLSLYIYKHYFEPLPPPTDCKRCSFGNGSMTNRGAYDVSTSFSHNIGIGTLKCAKRVACRVTSFMAHPRQALFFYLKDFKLYCYYSKTFNGEICKDIDGT